ncbi:hypothetical protein [Rodentibacter pneumotropicus]|nr:hypothetical protein [Rodentibacter pneumotropicus]THA18356.1 hypothetical protein D3M83_05825 [Rodentibacter pneumotropicus]
MNTLPYSRTNSTKFGMLSLNFIPSFYMNAISPALTGWENVLYQYDCSVEDEEIWALVRGSEAIPHFGNLYQSLVLNRLASLFLELTGLEEDDVNIFVFINGFDTHFCINGMAVNDESMFQDTVKMFKKLQRHKQRMQKKMH